MPAVWAILSCCLFGIVFVNGDFDYGNDCLNSVKRPGRYGLEHPPVWTDILQDSISVKRLQKNANFQSKMFAAKKFYDWLCLDPQNNRAVCRNHAACAFLIRLNGEEDEVLKSEEYLEDYPPNNMKLIDNDYTASDKLMLKEVFTSNLTFPIIASNDKLLVNTMTNEAIIEALLKKQALFDNVMNHKDFVAALEKNEKLGNQLRAKLVTSVQAFDTLTKFFDKQRPLALAQLVFDCKPELKGIFRMIFIIPMVITLVLALFALIMMWGACYPWMLIRKPGEPDIEDEGDEMDKKGKDKDNDKKGKKDKDDKTGNEKTVDKNEKDKKEKDKVDKKDKDKDSALKKGLVAALKKGSDKDTDKDKKGKKDKDDKTGNKEKGDEDEKDKKKNDKKDKKDKDSDKSDKKGSDKDKDKDKDKSKDKKKKNDKK